MKKPIGYMVFWEVDDDARCLPMQIDTDCDGAICVVMGPGDRPVLFKDRKAARRAIEISRRAALLAKAQGDVVNVNEDFLPENARLIKIRAVEGLS